MIGLSLNASSIADYTETLPFIDLMKQARKWGNGWAAGFDYLEANGYLDASGWPTSIPPGWTDPIRTIWSNPAVVGPHVLTYLGAGTINLGGVSGVSASAGRIEFTANGEFWMDIAVTDPLVVGNYIRNVRIVKAENEALADGGALLNPDYGFR